MTCLPSRPPPLQDFTQPPPITRPLVSDALNNSFSAGATSDALDNSFAAGATSDELNNSFAAGASTYNDNGNTGGEGGLVDLSAVETVAATVGGGEVHSVNLSDDSSDDEESKE